MVAISQKDTPTWSVGPAPQAVPVLGHLAPLRRRPVDFLASLSDFGDLLELRFGPRRAWIVCHPQLVQHINQTPAVFDKGGPIFDKLRSVLGNGVATCPHSEHKRQRQLVQPAFQPARLASYAVAMSEEAAKVADGLRADRTVHVGRVTDRFATRVAVRTLIPTTLEPAEDLQRCLPVVLNGLQSRVLAPIDAFHRLPTPANRRFDRAFARLHQLIDEIIADHRRSGTDRGDLLSTLLAGVDNTDESAAREAHDQIMTFLVASVETSAKAMAWSFQLLADHPDIESKLHAEVDRALGGRAPTFEDLPRLDYARRVFMEALRLHPPALIGTRTTTQDTELAGVRIKAGSFVVFSPYVLHRSAKYFPQPERFDPDRWLPDRARAVPRGAFFPFGGGSRICIGERFAITSGTLLLAAISAKWSLRAIPGVQRKQQIEMAPGPGELPMVCEPREPHQDATEAAGAAEPAACPWQGIA
jgi:cytochrome P450